MPDNALNPVPTDAIISPFTFFTPEAFTWVVTLFLLFLIVIYTVFTLIMVRQVHLLNRNFKTGLAFIFTMISYIHLFLALILVVVSLVTLIL
ncbi:MAG: hypothetical protein UU77_C0006G0002 [candidate division WWE3 bacterium GW2011_GWC1_41_7]|uniref:Uncharacterized protein n=3 Tax=Katanobacteria TaxID=422282 RepID=A0A0G0ZJ30_UNCKA|nr:MAG: hypothetical protein UU72_C0009G0026 [candidate division WWE3 bacterium GW2011_GWB1_41_6]KKS21215.1 MAG: hypothetical protein UU77_C0006G0002 [candidate division WWE3 bacterium GW2011_GWC1_41_7]KKS22056.1 MAG: hypothetical protein UU80_C0014G0011 [candidate division WWE3 bacterium GW2011_GWA1_41_8]